MKRFLNGQRSASSGCDEAHRQITLPLGRHHLASRQASPCFQIASRGRVMLGGRPSKGSLSAFSLLPPNNFLHRTSTFQARFPDASRTNIAKKSPFFFVIQKKCLNLQTDSKVNGVQTPEAEAVRPHSAPSLSRDRDLTARRLGGQMGHDI